MTASHPIVTDPGETPTVEGFVRVVAVDDGVVWLEPEPGTSCGGCAVHAGCGGAKGLGSPASRIAARRFALRPPAGQSPFIPGDRLVVAVPPAALLRASLGAYGLPLLAVFATAVPAQALFADDATTLLAGLAGMLLGVGLMRLATGGAAARGDLTPRIVRRVLPCSGSTKEGNDS